MPRKKIVRAPYPNWVPGSIKDCANLEVKYWTDHDLLNFVPSAINLGVIEHSKTRDDDWQVAHAFKHVHQGWR